MKQLWTATKANFSLPLQAKIFGCLQMYSEESDGAFVMVISCKEGE
jgi:hypothetical protein